MDRDFGKAVVHRLPHRLSAERMRSMVSCVLFGIRSPEVFLNLEDYGLLRSNIALALSLWMWGGMSAEMAVGVL